MRLIFHNYLKTILGYKDTRKCMKMNKISKIVKMSKKIVKISHSND